MALYNVPAENTRSTPKTERTVAGKPNAQYVALGLMRAKRIHAPAVPRVPIARWIKI